MNATQVLSTARDRHVAAFVRAMADLGPCHDEPPLRLADGTLATDGAPPIPLRVDLIVKKSDVTVGSGRITSTVDLGSSPVGAVDDLFSVLVCLGETKFASDNADPMSDLGPCENAGGQFVAWHFQARGFDIAAISQFNSPVIEPTRHAF